jgi:hypothetical protein
VVFWEINAGFTPLVPNTQFRQLPTMAQLKALASVRTEYVAVTHGLKGGSIRFPPQTPRADCNKAMIKK